MSESQYSAFEARERLISVVLRRLGSERDEQNAHYADELDYCDDLLLEAAENLVRAYE